MDARVLIGILGLSCMLMNDNKIWHVIKEYLIFYNFQRMIYYFNDFDKTVEYVFCKLLISTIYYLYRTNTEVHN
jgi:hypothetical protein